MKRYLFHFYVEQFEKFREAVYRAPDLDSAISMLREDYGAIRDVNLVEDGKYIRINL